MSTHDLLLLLLPILLIAALLVLFLPLQRTRMPSEPPAGRPLGEPLNRDDDQYWYGGVFYYNPDDPAVFIPKRFGLGWTVNFGHPGGKVLAAIMVAMALLPIALALFVPGFASHGCHPSSCNLTP